MPADAATRAPAATVAAAVLCSATVAMVAAAGPWPAVVLALPVIVAAVLVGRRHDVPEVVDAALVSGGLSVFLLLPLVRVWPIAPLLALVVVGGWPARRGTLARWRTWLRWGHVDRTSVALVLGVQVVSVVALLVWTRLFDGALPEVYADAARSAGPVAASLGGLVFLVVNGLVEDSLFFGVLLSALHRTLPDGVALAVAATAFGVAHLHGIPHGAVGVVMAGAWALMLAALRLRTGGMLATYAAHVVADTTIVLMLLPAVFS